MSLSNSSEARLHSSFISSEAMVKPPSLSSDGEPKDSGRAAPSEQGCLLRCCRDPGLSSEGLKSEPEESPEPEQLAR